MGFIQLVKFKHLTFKYLTQNGCHVQGFESDPCQTLFSVLEFQTFVPVLVSLSFKHLYQF